MDNKEAQELIEQGICPCGTEDQSLQDCCSVTGCPMYKTEEFKKTIALEQKNKELKEAKQRIAQLEDTLRHNYHMEVPKPDPTLAEDEWYAIFSNYQDKTSGYITKIMPRELLGSSSLFKVKKVLYEK